MSRDHPFFHKVGSWIQSWIVHPRGPGKGNAACFIMLLVFGGKTRRPRDAQRRVRSSEEARVRCYAHMHIAPKRAPHIRTASSPDVLQGVNELVLSDDRNKQTTWHYTNKWQSCTKQKHILLVVTNLPKQATCPAR